MRNGRRRRDEKEEKKKKKKMKSRRDMKRKMKDISRECVRKDGVKECVEDGEKEGIRRQQQEVKQISSRGRETLQKCL